jgi:cellulose biosynthesis protein BcsQ
MGTFPAVAASSTPQHGPVIAVTSNKGGVGKTTVATNLAVYLRALDEDLPILLISLDDQGTLDRMFALQPLVPGTPNLKHVWAERSLDRVIQLGEYGVHFVPSPSDATLLKIRAEDPTTLRRILDRTDWSGVIIMDTKSDLEALTRNALHAADRIVVPVSDWAALEEAGKCFAYLSRTGLGIARARVLFTLVDSRTRVSAHGDPLFQRLHAEVLRRGWPSYRTYLSRSPRVEALNSADGKPRAILHHAPGTRVHGQMLELSQEIREDLGLAPVAVPAARRAPQRSRAPEFVGDLKTALLRGLRGR